MRLAGPVGIEVVDAHCVPPSKLRIKLPPVGVKTESSSLDIDDSRLPKIRARGGVDVEGKRSGFGAVERASMLLSVTAFSFTCRGLVTAKSQTSKTMTRA
jgi:hypothetical protein